MTIKIALSGAAGNIGYALLPLLASGYIFGSNAVELRLLEIPQAVGSLEGTKMELMDCSFPCLTDVITTADPIVAFNNADVIILVGGMPRRKGMALKDLIQANTKIFSSMGSAIQEVASPNAKVLVVANPANTNCLVALTEASRIPTKNFCALTYLDHNRAKGQVALRLGVSAKSIKNVTIWGNHSETQYPDALSGGYCVTKDGKNVPLRDLLADDLDWATNDFIHDVQNRGKAVIEARGLSSAMSAAQATADCLRTWLVTGTQAGETVSMAVYNDQGYYGVKEGIVFSFPCECRNGEWFVKEGLQLSEFSRNKLRITEEELLEEMAAAQELIGTPPSVSSAPPMKTRTVSMSTCSSELSLATAATQSDISVCLTSRM